jgi:hypothetical protein
MNLILNEKLEAQRILKSSSLGEDTNWAIKILIKYYKSQEMTTDAIRDEIEYFLQKNMKDFNTVSMGEYLDGLVRKYSKDGVELIQRDSIKITNKEIEMIKSIGDINLGKLCFVMLVICKCDNAKASKFGFWVNRQTSEIFNEAGIKRNTTQQCAMLYKLREIGMIDISRNTNKTGIQLKYVECLDVENDEDVAIKMDSFQQLDMIYKKLIGENIVECTECGRLIECKANNNKYCPTCAKSMKSKNTLKARKIRKTQ